MGYEIFTGLRLETLVEAHLDLFGAGFFGPRPLLAVQNQSLAQWLKLFLARSRGGYATGDFVFQDELLRRLIETRSKNSPDQRVLFLDDLKFALYRRLAEVLPSEPALAPLRQGGLPAPGRLFELADHIAGVFHNYAMNSRMWLPALKSGVLPSATGADPETFAWQSWLWRDLLVGDTTLAGLRLDELTASPPPPPSGAPQRIVLIGSAFLSRRAAAFLRAWADKGLIDVVHLLLLPAPPEPAWPARRPWSSWGAFGRAFLEAFPAAPCPAGSPAAATALQRLQASLADGTGFEGAPDGTVELVSCPHPLRELEVLRDRLFAALSADPTLELHEIAVLAPDINVYAPFLDAAFASDDPGRRLNFHVIDLDLGRENAWFRALDALMTLMSAPIDRPSLFALIDTPPFRQAWDLDAEERGLWLEYTETVSAWREEPGPQSWSASWDRLFEGWFRTDSPGMPLSVSPSAFRGLGRFYELMERLAALRAQTRRPRLFSEWVAVLDTAAAFLAPDDAGAALSGRLRTLAEAEDFVLPWDGFRAFVQDQIAHFPGRRGQLLTEGLHCSSLRPLRAIPFRVVAVLGLDDGAFPRRTQAPSFDLTRYEPGYEALSAAALDRYCFWETVMAARDLLYLSYQGRSAVDGAPRPPSAVLADLQDHMETPDGAWPVNEASVKDFSMRGGTTWSPRTRRRAEAVLRSRTGLPDRLPQPPALEGPDPFPEVGTGDVVSAFTTPARFYLQRVRQVMLRDEDRRSVEEEEPWSLDFFDRHAWLAEGLADELAGREIGDVSAFVRDSVALGRAREGVFADRDQRELTFRAEQLSAWARSLRGDGWKLEPRTPKRTLWSGRPWSPDQRPVLTRGGEVLVPVLLYGGSWHVRGRFEAAARVLLDPPEGAVRLSALAPSGARVEKVWNPALDARTLAGAAEAYWEAAVRKPLPFYPDLLETLAERRKEHAGEPWTESLENAWHAAREGSRFENSSTFARCPYAQLAFADDPEWSALAAELEPWWNTLFVPLLEAWQ